MRAFHGGFGAGVLLAICLLPGHARADNFEEFGFGARAKAMGNASTGLATDPTATYYNPAGLIYSRHLNLQLGYSFADYSLGFDSQRGGDLDNQAERITDLSALSIGFSTTIPVDVPDRIGVGLALYMPTRGVIDLDVRAFGSEPEWYRYGDRVDTFEGLLAFGLKITDSFSIGIGTAVTVGAEGGTVIAAGLTAPVDPSFETKVKPSARAIVGMRFDLGSSISLGLTYRSEGKIEIDFPATVVFQGVTIPIDLDATQYFKPHQLQFGLAIAPTDRLLLTFDFLWAHWSSYDDLFLVVRSDVAPTVDNLNASLRDTFSPRLGVEFAATDWLLLRGGYFFRNSSVGDQDDEPTNLVDSDKHVLTFGLGLAFGAEPEEIGDEAKGRKRKRSETIQEALADASFDFDLFAQIHFHTEVSTNKALAADPVGDWDADGTIINLGFTFTARF